MAGRKSDFTLPKFDDIFSTQEMRDDEKLAKIRDIPLELIDDFPDHPYRVQDDEDMDRLVESIKERGVITPAMVRQKEDGRYELISGHRRKRACEIAGFGTLRCEIVELTRDEAIILMVESNYQRTQQLPSERAFAYKMRLEAMARQGKRTDLTCATELHKSDGKKSRYTVADKSGETVRRYAVKTNTDPDNPQEVATMDDNKKQLLKDLFWEMNEVSSRTESVSETVITETDDGNGNIVQTETTVTRTYLYITVDHKTVDEMASQYGFNQEQKDYLTELLKPENNSLWAAALYGINYSDDQIVTVALTQIGNVGGDPYWSWYGFGSRVEWCACFVSWCANECGYIDTGVIPKYAGCVNGVQWFKDRGQWVDGSAEPVAGMIIFFDWDSPDGESGPQDGLSDHTGIVQKVENGIVYTVEGNSGDSVRQKQYSVGYYEILGYGVPQY